MINVAIVGASSLGKEQMEYVKNECESLLKQFIIDYGINNITFISGGAKGVDTIAENMAKKLNITPDIKKPETPHWEDQDGKIGFKTRNLMIADKCDILYCFPSKYSNEECYHCGKSIPKHQVSGGCWTLKKAREMGKRVFLIQPKI